jgi:hypothetical protein
MRFRSLVFWGTCLILGCGKEATKGPGSEVEWPDAGELAEHTARFRGKVVQVHGTLKKELGLAQHPSLKLAAGSDISMKCPNGQDSFNLVLSIPSSLENLPNAKPGDEVLITFACGEGSLTQGNTVVRIGMAGP